MNRYSQCFLTGDGVFTDNRVLVLDRLTLDGVGTVVRSRKSSLFESRVNGGESLEIGAEGRG